MNMTPEQLKLATIFMPYELGRLTSFLGRNGKLVHYTSAEVAVRIIQNKQMWMRNAYTMNDFSEINYGIDCVKSLLGDSEASNKFREIVDTAGEGTFNELMKRFSSWLPHFQSDTYITCLSEHLPEEDEHGRLSMWRAYGARNGVAIIINTEPLQADTDLLKAYSSPVSYIYPADFVARFSKILADLALEIDILNAMSQEDIIGQFFSVLKNTVLCTKHPGFQEEREWRIIYSPTVDKSPAIFEEIEIVGSVPQIVNKIPLKDEPESGLFGADIPNLIHRIIIGPSEDQFTILHALSRVLEAEKIPNPMQVIQVSGIPLRT